MVPRCYPGVSWTYHMSMVMPTRPERVLGSALHILTMCCKDCPLKIFNPFRKAFYNMVSALSPSLSLYISQHAQNIFGIILVRRLRNFG